GADDAAAVVADLDVDVPQRDACKSERQLTRRGVDAGLDVGGDLERRLRGIVEVVRGDVERARAGGQTGVVVEIERQVDVEGGVDVHERVGAVADAGRDLVFAVGRLEEEARRAAGRAAARAVAADAAVHAA